METIGVGATHVGKKREGNEDAYWVDNELGVYLVADGMGGHAAGEIAAQMTVDTVREIVTQHRDAIERVRSNPEAEAELRTIGEQALTEACARIYREASANPGKAGMGCTATLIIVAGQRAAMAHVGDSRLYLHRGGKGHQISRDHTLAQELFANGVLTADEVKTHHYAHVLSRAIGVQPAVRVDTLPIQLLPGDRFLLCSDGLADYVPDVDWVSQRLADADPEAIVDGLIDFANDAGGKDNITVVVVHVEGDEGDTADSWITGVTLRMKALRKVPLFDNLSLAQHNQIMNLCQDVTYESGDLVAKEGDTLDRMYMVVDGELSISRSGAHLDRLGPGSSLGATSLAHPRRARASVYANARTRVLQLSRDDFGELARRRPWLGVKLLRELAGRLSRELDWAIADRAPDPGGPTQLV